MFVIQCLNSDQTWIDTDRICPSLAIAEQVVRVKNRSYLPIVTSERWRIKPENYHGNADSGRIVPY